MGIKKKNILNMGQGYFYKSSIRGKSPRWFFRISYTSNYEKLRGAGEPLSIQIPQKEKKATPQKRFANKGARQANTGIILLQVLFYECFP